MEIELRDLAKNLIVLFMAEEGDAGVLVAPDRVHYGERDKHPGSDHRIDLAEFASFGAPANDSTEESESACGNLFSVEAREIGELVQLAEDKAVQGIEDWRADEGPVPAHCPEELLAGGTALARRPFAGFDGCDRGMADYLAEELFLIREVEVNGAFGDSGACGNILEPGFGQSALTEDLERGLDDLLRPVFRSSAPLWRFWSG